MFACQFCKKEYKTASNLKLHIKTAKFCLKIQEEKSPNNTSIVKNKTKSCHTCSFCKKDFTSKRRLDNHLILCKYKIKAESYDDVKKIKKEFEKNKNLLEEAMEDKIRILTSLLQLSEESKNETMEPLTMKDLECGIEYEEPTAI